MGEGEPNPEWDEIVEGTGLDLEQVPITTQLQPIELNLPNRQNKLDQPSRAR